MQTAENRNTATLKQAYAEWHRTKAERTDMWTSIVADGFHLCSVTDSAIEGIDFCRVYRSRDELADYFSAITKDWEMVYYEPQQFIAQGDKVAVVANACWRFKRTGKEAAIKKVDVWTFDAAGQATDFFETFDTATVLAATQ
jgi:ketosteroid isomerase-like protein